MKSKNMLIIFLILILKTSCIFIKGNQSETALLKFVILDENSGKPIPGKFVFVKENDDKIKLNIPETYGLAPEGNGFFTAFGKGEVKIPAGTYTIYVSRGMEYSIDKKTLALEKGAAVEQKWLIKREFNPAGYIGADFHMHTSNVDGALCSEEERVTSLIGEGVEFAVASDHNFVTDFNSAVNKLGAEKYIKTCRGNELSTKIGHFNIFPLPANTEPFDPNPIDPDILFKYREPLPGPVVNQVNHPRWGVIDYYRHLGIEPVTSESENPLLSENYDAVEIMNETIGWGLATCIKNKISVWDEWFNFLNKGFRVTGVGNSDSHVLLSMPVGWPRNYVASTTENPAELDEYALAQNIIDHKVSVSRGIFVNLTVNREYPIGSELIDTDGTVELLLEVFAPSWVQVDKITVYANAREIWSAEIPEFSGALTYQTEITLKPQVDTWYIVKAEGSKSLWPVVPDQHELSVTPLGFTNPIWIDIDGQGFETERDRAKQFMLQNGNDMETMKREMPKMDWWFQRQLLALVDKDSAIESLLLTQLFNSDVKLARKYAISQIGNRGNPDVVSILKSAKNSLKDANERMIVDTYISKFGPRTDMLDFMFTSIVPSDRELRMEQSSILSLKQYLTEWKIVGPFANEKSTGLNTVYGPEENIDLNASFADKNNRAIKWQHVTAEENGYVDLLKAIMDQNNSVAYAYATINCPDEFETVVFFGSDDGAVLWLNGQELYRLRIGRSANPYDELLPITLKKGENTFLVKVENGSGNWGLYLEVFDPLNRIIYQ